MPLLVLPEAHYLATAQLEVCLADASGASSQDIETLLERLYNPAITRSGDVNQAKRYWDCVGMKDPKLAKSKRRLLAERRAMDARKMETAARNLYEGGAEYSLARLPGNTWLCTVRHGDGRKVEATGTAADHALWLAYMRI